MKIPLLSIFLLFSLSVFSQGINNLWLMGYQSWAGYPFGGTNLDFSGGAPVINFENRIMNFNCTNGVICDKNGNLLFCSNGIYVANNQLDTMLNGGGLNPSVYTTMNDSDGLSLDQANLILPFPNDSTKYYLFHETCDDYGNSYCSFYLYYSIIDITLDSGKGSVIQKNVVLLNDSLVIGRLTACRHANGRDWWLIAHKYNSTTFYKYLVTPAGISAPYLQNIGVLRSVWRGQCTFSPDGSRFAYYEPWMNDLDIFSFDRCTGTFSNAVHVDFSDSTFAGGVSFSSNSNVLYVTSEKYIYQFNLTAANIAASQLTVAVWDGYYSPSPPLATLFYTSLLAPDGKIYVICGNSTMDIHVINNPDSLGIGCDVCQHCVHLPAFNAFTIPNHPNYFLGAEGGTICDSLPTSVISLESLNNNFNAFPNPANGDGEITFTYNPFQEQATISIFNVDGKEVAKYHLPQWSSMQRMRLPELAIGVYFARFTSKNRESFLKFAVE